LLKLLDMSSDASTQSRSLTFSPVATRCSTPPAPSLGAEADRHAEASRTFARRLHRLTLLAAAVAALFAAVPERCLAEEDSTPSILGYALEGFGTGVAVGFATGYLATGPKFEGGEWRTVLWGGGIGALTGLGLGLVLGIVDAATVPSGRGVGFYIMRDSNYGYTVGALAGGVIGALVWAGGGVAKDVLIGLAWGTVIGAGAGVVLGIVEGALRSGKSNTSHAQRRGPFQVGLGFTPSLEGGAPITYPTLTARF
jgi:hypothetical protein